MFCPFLVAFPAWLIASPMRKQVRNIKFEDNPMMGERSQTGSGKGDLTIGFRLVAPGTFLRMMVAVSGVTGDLNLAVGPWAVLEGVYTASTASGEPLLNTGKLFALLVSFDLYGGEPKPSSRPEVVGEETLSPPMVRELLPQLVGVVAS